MVTPYVADTDGRMIPERPRACPWAPAGVECRMVVEHWRPRKTGPEHALLVMSCRDHRRAFTLYPCGHVPYGRVAVAPVREDGVPLSDRAFAVTVFGAALDARAGALWRREQPGRARDAGGVMHYRTQGRRLERSAALIGLVSEHVQPLIARRLGISTLELRDAARTLQASTRTRARGTLVSGLLDRIEIRPGILDAILIAGALADEWGPPIRWEPSRQRRRFLFPPTGAPP
jgi:hypothetical protein